MTTWTATTESELQEISGLLGDAYFDADDVRWDHRERLVVVPFAQEWDWAPLNNSEEWRAAPRAEVVRLSWWRSAQRVPFMRGTVRIRHATAFDLGRAGDAGKLLGLAYDIASCKLTMEGVSGHMTASVDQLDVVADLSPIEVGLYVLRRKRLGGTYERPLP